MLISPEDAVPPLMYASRSDLRATYESLSVNLESLSKWDLGVCLK
jgi:hypothetical protein